MADSTVGTGGDYSDLATWEAATDNNLVGTTTIERALLLNETFTLTAAVVVSGATTSASYYREIKCAAGASFRDNANVRTNALTYDTANGAAITSSTSYLTPLIDLAENHARIRDIQTRTTTASSYPLGLSNTDSFADSCILDGSNALQVVALNGTPAYATNCLVIQRAASATRIARCFDASYLVNCTLVVPSGTAAATLGIQRPYPVAATFTNNAVFGATDFGGTTSTTYTNCYGDDASPPTGVTQVAYDTSTGSGFESVTADFRIKSTSALVGAGTSTGAPAADISGTTRASPPGVGAWEYVAPAGGAAIARITMPQMIPGGWGRR